MHEHILAAVITDDEAEALLTVEEFDHAGAFADHLGRHAATTAAAATTEAATAAAAETTAATAAETITATAETVATATESITAAAETIATAEAAATEIIAAETVALIAATPTAIPAASFIETHALFVFPASPKIAISTRPRWTKARLFGRQTYRATESV